MKIAKQIVSGQIARTKLLEGINIAADTIASTLGPRSRNVAINNPHSTPEIFKDGVTVARAINLEDPIEDMGAEFVRAAADKVVERAGDGTTTVSILMQSIVQEAFTQIAAGGKPMEIKENIDRDLITLLKELDKLSTKVTNDEQVKNIAAISASNKELGAIIAEAIIKTGKDGFVIAEPGKTIDTYVEYKKGMEIDRGYTSPYFVTNNNTQESIIEDAYILLTDKQLSYNFEVVPFVENFAKTSRNLVIISGSLQDEALAFFVVNKLKGLINVVGIQAPAWGARRIDELHDLAILTGGTVIIEDSGRKLDSVMVEELGRAQRVVVDRDKTIIYDGKGHPDAIKSRIDELKGQIKLANTDFDKQIKEQRMAKLASSVAMIHVGHITETEMTEKIERVKDAIHATKHAVDSGYVAGGEMTLYYLSKHVTGIMHNALKKPFKKILDNAGLDYGESMQKITGRGYPYGIDVTSGKCQNMIESGIIDPAKVVKTILESAVSYAGLVTTTDYLITDAIKKS